MFFVVDAGIPAGGQSAASYFEGVVAASFAVQALAAADIEHEPLLLRPAAWPVADDADELLPMAASLPLLTATWYYYFHRLFLQVGWLKMLPSVWLALPLPQQWLLMMLREAQLLPFCGCGFEGEGFLVPEDVTKI